MGARWFLLMFRSLSSSVILKICEAPNESRVEEPMPNHRPLHKSLVSMNKRLDNGVGFLSQAHQFGTEELDGLTFNLNPYHVLPWITLVKCCAMHWPVHIRGH